MQRKSVIAITVLIIFIIVVLSWFIFRDTGNEALKRNQAEVENGSGEHAKKENGEDEECITKKELKTVRGGSLSGLVEDGATIKALYGYYDCHRGKRGDIVLYSYAGNDNPLIKVIKAAPGDQFSLEEAEAGGGWNIVVNGEILETSAGEPYVIAGKKYDMLALYEKDYGDGIPENTYILLGEQPSGSMDSTRFGLVHKDDILAKAVLVEDE